MTLFFKSYLKLALVMFMMTLAIDGQAMNKRSYNVAFEDQILTQENENKKPCLNDDNSFYTQIPDFNISNEHENDLKELIEQEKQKELEDRYNKLVERVKKSKRIINFAELLKNKETAEALVTVDEVTQALEDFIDTQHTKLSETSLWLNNQVPQPFVKDKNGEYQYKNSKIFVPFVGKQIYENDQKFKVFGDLHGDIHTLFKFLENDVDGFTIKDKKTHLVFLGDFVDRGSYGIEVIYLITQLAKHNPGRVIICRGNHEDMGQIELMNSHQSWTNWSFKQELLSKYGKDKADQLLEALAAFYNLLPDAYLIGTKNSKDTYDYALCCHGSIEPRHRLNDLIDSEKPEVFEYVDKFVDIKKCIDEHNNKIENLDENDTNYKEINEKLCANIKYYVESKRLYKDGNEELKKQIDRVTTDLNTYKELWSLANFILTNPNSSQKSSCEEQLMTKNTSFRESIKLEYVKCFNEFQKNQSDTFLKKQCDEFNRVVTGLKEQLTDLNKYRTFTCEEYNKLKRMQVTFSSSNYQYELNLRWNDIEKTNITTNYFGYLWGMFDEKSKDSIVSFDTEHNRMCYGKKLVDFTFNPTDKGNQIKAMFKGHQHNHVTLKDLHDSNGIFKFWTDKDKQWDGNEDKQLKLNEKEVVLYDAPVSFFGNADNKTMVTEFIDQNSKKPVKVSMKSHNPRNWGTFAELTLANKFENWVLKPIKKDIF